MSRQGHKRYTITRELSGLVGKEVFVSVIQNGCSICDSGVLSKDGGYFLTGNNYFEGQIPVRAITFIEGAHIKVNRDYRSGAN